METGRRLCISAHYVFYHRGCETAEIAQRARGRTRRGLQGDEPLGHALCMIADALKFIGSAQCCQDFPQISRYRLAKCNQANDEVVDLMLEAVSFWFAFHDGRRSAEVKALGDVNGSLKLADRQAPHLRDEASQAQQFLLVGPGWLIAHAAASRCARLSLGAGAGVTMMWINPARQSRHHFDLPRAYIWIVTTRTSVT